jgi:hypothetical protein
MPAAPLRWTLVAVTLPLAAATACPLATSPTGVWLALAQTPNGLGAWAHHVLYVQAYAHARGWGFAGVPAVSLENRHFVAASELAAVLFGDVSCVLAPSVLPSGNLTRVELNATGQYAALAFTPGQDASEAPFVAAPGSVLYVASPDLFFVESWAPALDAFFTPALLAQLRAAAAPRLAEVLMRDQLDAPPPPPLPRHLRPITMAAHVRRGDAQRPPSLEFIFLLVSVLEAMHPGRLLLKIFSEDMPLVEQAAIAARAATAGLTLDHRLQMHVAVSAPLRRPELAADEDGLTADPNATAEVLRAVANFATADVLVQAISMLSRAAAILNPHCVVYTQAAAGHGGVTSQYLVHKPLAHWLDVYADFEAGREVRLRMAAFFAHCLR